MQCNWEIWMEWTCCWTDGDARIGCGYASRDGGTDLKNCQPQDEPMTIPRWREDGEDVAFNDMICQYGDGDACEVRRTESELD